MPDYENMIVIPWPKQKEKDKCSYCDEKATDIIVRKGSVNEIPACFEHRVNAYKDV